MDAPSTKPLIESYSENLGVSNGILRGLNEDGCRNEKRGEAVDRKI
jgi:hypothetical protein